MDQPGQDARTGGPMANASAAAAARSSDLGPLDQWTLREHLRFAGSSKGGQRILDFFRKADRDKSGELSPAEFGRALRQYGFSRASDRQIDAVFAVCDVDGSGAIPYRELDTILRQIGPRPAKLAALASQPGLQQVKALRDGFPKPPREHQAAADTQMSSWRSRFRTP